MQAGGSSFRTARRSSPPLPGSMQIPVTTTLMGMGVFPSGDPLSLGMLGMHGTYAANMAVTNADCLIAMGARFDDRVTGKVDEFAPKAKIIHIDIDPTSISKNVQVDLPIVGDCKMVLQGMLARARRAKEARSRSCTRRSARGSTGRYLEEGAAPEVCQGDVSSSPSTSSRRSTRSPPTTPSSPPRSARTRCGPPSSTNSRSRGSSSHPEGSGPWATASRQPSGPRWHSRAARSSTSQATDRSR